jgi:hypothetical protein
MGVNYGYPKCSFYRDFVSTPVLNPSLGGIGGPIDFGRSGSGTYIGSDGYIKTAASNEPRFTYEYDSNNILRYRGLYLDNRTSFNNFTHSEDFSNNSWTKTNSSVSLSSTLSPNGIDNGTRLQVSSSGGNIRSSFSFAAGNLSLKRFFYISIMAKAAECSHLNISISNGSYSFDSYFNLNNGTTGNNTNGTINQLTYVYKYICNMGNGWYRCVLCGYDNQTVSTYTVTFTPSTNPTSIVSSSGDGLLIFGANADYHINGTPLYHYCFASYIKTNGSAASVPGDTCYVSLINSSNYNRFLNNFNSDRFSMYAEFTLPHFFRSTISSNIVTLYGSTRLNSNNHIATMRVNNANINYTYRTPAAWDFGTFAVQENNNKMIITNKLNPPLISSMNGTLATSLNSLVISKFDSLYFVGTCMIKKIIYIPTNITTSHIQRLTTL